MKWLVILSNTISMAQFQIHLSRFVSSSQWYVSLGVKRNLLTLGTQPLKLDFEDCQEHPVTQDWTVRSGCTHPPTPSPPSPEISSWLLFHQCIVDRTTVSKKELHFVLLGDIGLERPSIGGRDQNGKIIEEIITCFTLQTTLTRSSIEKAHRGRIPPRSM